MAERRRRVMRAIRALDPRSIGELIGTTGLSRIAVCGTVWDLRKCHLATRNGRARYQLTERGRRIVAAMTTAATLFR